MIKDEECLPASPSSKVAGMELVHQTQHEMRSIPVKLIYSPRMDQKYDETQKIDTEVFGQLADMSSEAKSLLVPHVSSVTMQNEFPCPQMIYRENVERKQYSEREITYNLLLRKLVDEFLDRTITYSHQPKHILAVLKCVLERNFPDFGESFHRERICAYLKACRRNAKKKNGEPYVRISARYLSAGTAARIANQIYLKEQDNLAELILGAKQTMKRESDSLSYTGCTNLSNQLNTTQAITNPPIDLLNSNQYLCIDKTVNCSDENEIILNQNKLVNAECTFARLLEQTAEFLILIADKLDAGQMTFPLT